MANELIAKYSTGITAKLRVWKADLSQVWDDAANAWVTFAVEDIADYKITATDLSGVGHYAATFPPEITTAGTFYCEFLNNSDNSVFANQLFDWSGAAAIPQIAYYPAIYYSRDGDSDDYIVVWYRNGIPITSGITSPTIQVYLVADGSDLIDAATAMTEIASTGTYKYTTTADRLSRGTGAVAKVTATIDGVVRVGIKPIGRDSV